MRGGRTSRPARCRFHGLFLTAGADVQADRIEVSVWAWGRGKESWLVEHRILSGDTSLPEVWAALTGMLVETWPHEAGTDLKIARLATDNQYRTTYVHAWARRVNSHRILVVVGRQSFGLMVSAPTAVDVTLRGKTLRRGLRQWNVGTSLVKTETYEMLNLERPTVESKEPFPPGYIHLSTEAADEEFCKQLTAERKVTKKIRGYPRSEWQKTRDRNEALDCRVYARAAANIGGLDRLREPDWQKLEQGLGVPRGLGKQVSASGPAERGASEQEQSAASSEQGGTAKPPAKRSPRRPPPKQRVIRSRFLWR